MDLRKTLGTTAALLSAMLVVMSAQPAQAETNTGDMQLEPNEAVRESQVIPDQSLPALEPRPDVTQEVLESLRVSVSYNGRALPNSSESQANNASQPSNSPAVARNGDLSDYKHSAGLDLPNFGWNQYQDGSIKSVLGFNVALGISYRSYFEPVEEGKFNWAYDVGTLGLVLPYAAIGGDYQTDGQFYIGAHVGAAALWYFDTSFLIPFGWVGLGLRL